MPQLGAFKKNSQLRDIYSYTAVYIFRIYLYLTAVPAL
jgi:hypothetical protein